MYFAILSNSANNAFIKSSKEFGQNLHTCFLTASNLHSTAITTIATLAYISDGFDAHTAPLNEWLQSHTGKAIEAIELMILTVRALLLNESVIVGEAEIYPLQCDNAVCFAKAFYDAFVNAHTVVAVEPLTTPIVVATCSLEALREIAKGLGVKNYHCYRNTEKLQAAIVMAQA